MTAVAYLGSELVRQSPEARPRAVVMTMGALHEGHRSLMRHARSLVGGAGEVVVTDFVNPTQFGAGEDYEAYPRTLAADIAACEAEGVDIVFAPDVTEVYGSSALGDAQWEITVDPGQLGEELEGVSRPGHFRGMLTVVHALFGITQSDFALFGEKDYQQLTLIKAMVQSLRIPVEVVGSPTVRESDGLAMSSRNVYLSHEERERAAAIPRALHAAIAQSGAGAAAMERAALLELDGKVNVDYCEVRTTDLRGPAVNGPARILVAGQVGNTRLIDNMAVEVVGP
jgi:pantoate--beta-alanine ligase